MKLKTVVVNGILAALYIAVSWLIQPLVFGNLQFRIPEIFNHLIIFNKKFFYGIVVGVFVTNLFSTLGIIDLVFGVGHSVISLLMTMFIIRFFKSLKLKLAINVLVFSSMMFIIALELKIAFGIPFLFGWLTTSVGEFLVMAIGAPLMYYLNKRLQFSKIMQ